MTDHVTDADLLAAMQSDPDFQSEMAATYRQRHESSGSVFSGYDLGGVPVAAPGPRVWRWLDICGSPLAPGGNFEDLTDQDLVIALAIIAQGRKAIAPYLSLPMRLRRADDPDAITAEVAAQAVGDAYDYIEATFGELTAQDIANFVLVVLQDHAPIAVKKNCDDVTTSGSEQSMQPAPTPSTSPPNK